jgi:hypothetical protein
LTCLPYPRDPPVIDRGIISLKRFVDRFQHCGCCARAARGLCVVQKKTLPMRRAAARRRLDVACSYRLSSAASHTLPFRT